MLSKLKQIDENELEKLILNSNSMSEVLRKLDISHSAECNRHFIRTFIKRKNVDVSHFRQIGKLEKEINIDIFTLLINNSNCWSEVMRGLGIPFHGNIINSLRKLAISKNI